MLETVILPIEITVHLGRPNVPAENVTVDFIYYLKNVASSEVYPTWPYEALRANIWAQMSLVLNRVYTEWYRGRGYPFDITNSTAFDQAFVPGRNIFDTISSIVDEVIGQYLQRPFFREPFYAEYCDGIRAQCPGLKQWGSMELSTLGYSSMDIIYYYYGDNMMLIKTDNFQYITPSYPGYPIQKGDSGQYVFIIQELLNGVAVNYPAVPLIYPPDSNFGEVTESAVRVFQQTFRLIVDGIVGQNTWNTLSRIYVGVRRIAELTSIGRLEGYFTGLWTGRVLRRGDIGIEVQQAQYFLSVVADAYPSIPPVDIDSRFGAGFERSVIAFQNEFGLVPDGIIGFETWTRIYDVYEFLITEGNN